MPTTTFSPTKDTWISSKTEWREQDNGSATSAPLHRRPSFLPTYSTRILMQFDLSSIAPGSTISSAALVLDWMAETQPSTWLAEVFRMVYHDWDDACNFSTIDGLPFNSLNGWPGLFFDPPAERNYASNDFDPSSSIVSSRQTTLVFGIEGYIPNALFADSGILSVLVQVPPGVSSFRTYGLEENALVGNRPTLTITWEPPSYVLTLTEGSGGSCTASPDQLAYQDGDVVTLTVTPDAGFDFSGWSGADAGDVTGPDGDGLYHITMDADKTIQCDFSASTFRLTLNEGSNGTSVLAPTGESPLHTYEENDLFLLLLTPDTAFQVDTVTVVSGDSVNVLVVTGQASDGYKHVSAQQSLTQDSEWTSVFKALHSLTTTIVGGAHGTVANGSAVLTWPQEPLYAFGFAHIVSIKPDVGYQAQVVISAGTIVNVLGTNLDNPTFGFEATDWLFTPPDADATLTVTWKLIAAGQAGGGLYHRPFDDDRGRIIL